MTRKGEVTHAHLQLEWPQHLNKRTHLARVEIFAYATLR